jgi:hypothetical protein
MQPHYPGMGRGLVRSISALVRGVSYYIRVRGSLEIWCAIAQNPGCPRAWGNTYHGISRATGRHLGSPAVVPELCSEGGTAGACRGGRLHRVGTHAKVDRWKAMIDYPNPAYLCMTLRGGIPADLSDGVGKVYNLCRV